MDLKAFASGAMSQPAASANGRSPRSEGLLGERTKPLIAAIEGWAIAGGLELALACDLVVSSREARFGLPEVKWGLLAAGGGLLRLAGAAPVGRVMEMALTAATYDAQQFSDWGLIQRLVKPGEALAGAIALADSIAAHPPHAVIATRQLVEAAAYPGMEAFLAIQAKLRADVFASAAALDGARSFTEGRR
jgi:enoyl-CoA hydratase